MQTLENPPALVHGGPFANIAHGCNSVSATDTAAASLCRRFGFTQIGCYPKFFHVDGKYQDGLIMNLYL